jgi:energy-coupling factor transport system permease protein
MKIASLAIGQYIPGKSALHKMDPRSKIITMTAMVVCLFLIKSGWGYAAIGLILLSGILGSRVGFKFIMRSMRSLLVIMLFTFILHIFMTEGTSIFKLGPFNATYEGAIQGGFMVARLILLVVATSLVTLTTSPLTLTDGLEKLMKPLSLVGFPAHELAMMMTIALRFIPTLVEETEKIMKAQMARGADFSGGNLVKRAKAMLPVLIPLFVSAFRRADELALAMEARCYRGGRGRTRLRKLMFGANDLIALPIVSISIMLAVFL